MTRRTFLAMFALFLYSAFPDTLELRENLLSVTNCWGRNPDLFSLQATSNAIALAKVGTADARHAIQDWCGVVLKLPVCTNDVETYRTWLVKKADCIKSCTNYVLDGRCTNLWMDIATFYADIGSSMLGYDEIVAMSRKKFSRRTVDMENETAMKLWVWEQSALMSARQQSLDRLRGTIVKIGERGILTLDREIQWCFYSNFVNRAHLQDSERGRIRRAIEAVGVR